MFDPYSDKTIGYHLFLLPPEPLKSEMTTLISHAAEKFNAPVFDPHATLLARIDSIDEGEVVEKAKHLAAQLHPFTLSLDMFAAEDVFFRAFYVKLKDSEEIQAAHREALKVFSMTDAGAYTPHLSILYGNLSEEKKDPLYTSLDFPSTHEFSVSSLHIYETKGETEKWKWVTECPFT